MKLKVEIRLKGQPLLDLYQRIFERDGFRCQICGKGKRDQLCPHHIIPRSRIRIDHADNLLTACGLCHQPLHDGNLVINGERVTVKMILDKYYSRVKKFLR